MEQGEIIDLLGALFLVLDAPPMLIGLCIGVIVALFQALTQIQEMTLVFVPKILAIFTAIAVMFQYDFYYAELHADYCRSFRQCNSIIDIIYLTHAHENVVLRGEAYLGLCRRS